MRTKRKKHTEAEIDAVVVRQAHDDSAWESAMRVKKSRRATLSLPAEQAARAAFFARIHRHPNTESWLQQIIGERLDVEAAVLAGVKRELARKG